MPLLLVPQGGDQPLIAERIQALGLGHWLRDLTASALLGRITDTLSDQAMVARVRIMGDDLRQAGGTERAADLLSAFACRHRS